MEKEEEDEEKEENKEEVVEVPEMYFIPSFSHNLKADVLSCGAAPRVREYT